jgi:hypothetical protein
MQALESTLEATPRSKSITQESFRPLETKTNFVDNGTITEKKDVFQEISQQLHYRKHTLTFGQFMDLALDLKQYVVSKVSRNSQPTHLQGSIAIFLHMAIIQVHLGKNIVEDVLLDGGLGVNIIIEDLCKFSYHISSHGNNSTAHGKKHTGGCLVGWGFGCEHYH